jgi:hypothetical protein
MYLSISVLITADSGIFCNFNQAAQAFISPLYLLKVSLELEYLYLSFYFQTSLSTYYWAIELTKSNDYIEG